MAGQEETAVLPCDAALGVFNLGWSHVSVPFCVHYYSCRANTKAAFCLPDSCRPERIPIPVYPVPPPPLDACLANPDCSGGDSPPAQETRAWPTSEALSLEAESLCGPGSGVFKVTDLLVPSMPASPVQILCYWEWVMHNAAW